MYQITALRGLSLPRQRLPLLGEGREVPAHRDEADPSEGTKGWISVTANQDKAVGRVTYASGEALEFTEPQEYLRTIREELPMKDVTGFRFETLTDDPAVRKAVDAMAYDLYGEKNPRPLEDYVLRQGPALGGTSM